MGQVPHQVQNLAHHLRVQSRGGLVKEHDLRLHSQSADDGNTLLLAAGEHVGILIRLVGQANALQQLHGLSVGLILLLQTQLNGGQSDVLLHRHMGEEVEMLEHHAHFPAVEVDVHLFVGDVHAVEVDVSAGGDLQQVQAPQQSRLTGTGGADDGNHLALLDGEGAVVKGLHRSVVVFLDDVLNTDELSACRHDAFSFQWPRWPCWRGS